MSTLRSLFLLALALLAIPAYAKDSWLEIQTPNFKIVSNAGEGEARKIAAQFEEFREVFRASFPRLRVDLGRPLVILAVKNEDTLKILLPEYWEEKGRVHPAGFYMPGDARHYVLLRTNVESENPYQVVYHEYTHAIMNLNFRGLPLWLSEGLAEYFGNSTIRDKEVEIGKISRSHLLVLQTGRLIPIDTLILADAHSPYYNEQNRASMFYAESWALVHYLMLDPDARKRQLLGNFLSAWKATDDQLAAAQQAFGDLKKFGGQMEAYARQSTFYFGKVPTSIQANQKSYAARPLSPAEVSAEESLFFIQTRREKEARIAADEALAADPTVALAHEAAGLLAYYGQDWATAQKEFARTMELDPADYVALYYEAETHLRRVGMKYEELPSISANLEKTIGLNPQFAPAYSALSNFYSMNPETYTKALALGKKAIELEPGNLNYASRYVYVLLNVGRPADAKTLATRIQAVAHTPQEQAMAAQLLNTVAAREKTMNSSNSFVVHEPKFSAAATPKDTPAVVAAPGEKTGENTPPPPPEAAEAHLQTVTGPEYHLEGKVVEVDCSTTGELKTTLSINSVLMKFHAANLKTLDVSPAAKLAPDKPPCANWKNQKAKVTFHSYSSGDYDGELTAIAFD